MSQKKFKRIYLSDEAISICDEKCIALSRFVEKKILELKSGNAALTREALATQPAPTTNVEEGEN